MLARLGPGKLAVSALVLTMCVAAGCRQSATWEMCSVAGTVTYQGKPVTDGFVVFTNAKTGVTHSGRLDEQGRYSIPELPVGEYKVHLGDPPPPGPESSESGAPLKPLDVPPRLKSPETSSLSAKLSPGKNRLDFNLD